MIAFLSRPARVLSLIRQCSLVAMLLVQATIVASPLFEPHTTGAPVTHVDETGTRHVDMHNEATCVVCAVRAMHVVPSAPVEAVTTALPVGSTPSTEVPRLSLHAALALYPSRAPPRLG
jgi:hypothetical protein